MLTTVLTHDATMSSGKAFHEFVFCTSLYAMHKFLHPSVQLAILFPYMIHLFSKSSCPGACSQRCSLVPLCPPVILQLAGAHDQDCSSGSVMPVMVVLVVLVHSKCANSSAAQSCQRWPCHVMMLALHALCVLLGGGCVVAAISCTQLHASV